MTYNKFKLLNLFIFLLSYLFFKVGSFTPEGRLAHSTVLVDNKLYFFGGYVDNAKSCTNQVFYLDLSQYFDLTAPPWISLTQISEIPFKSCWGTALLNDKEQTIYLFGGFMTNNLNKDEFVSNVHSFNLNSLSWNVPDIEGTTPERRRNMKGVIDNTGKIYIFGGYADKFLGSPTLIRNNDMVILNTAELELSWLIIPASKPYAQHAYTATLLSNGVIVYIGGTELLENTAKHVDIKNINLFDTNTLTWSVKVVTASNIIQNPSDDKIIIYGGANRANSIKAVPDLFVLNMENEQFEYIVPPVYGQLPPSLSAHTADLFENYMIITFGNITQPNDNPLPLKSYNIYIMDIRNYTWVNSFEVTNTNIAKNSDPNNSNKIIIASIGGTVVAAIIMACGFLFYRWNKNKKINELYPRYINEEHTLPGNIVEHNSSTYITK
ncbi:5156_t:CDS:2 [Funneliformis geosporum]|nr:5156_t:CDS:2 [Funneliformis geosporum]